MQIPSFKLEEYFAKYEFNSKYLLCSSDAQSFAMGDIIGLANEEEQELWNTLELGYTEAPGHPLLRQRIAERMYESMQPENVLCFSGAEEGIYATLKVLCNPTDHILVLTPCYQSLLEVPRMMGADVTEIQLREDNNWRIDLDQIRQSITSQTKGIIMNFPHNPTGQVLSETEKTQLVAIAEEHDLWIFSDEVYRLLGNPSEGWSQPLADAYPKAISLGVMSKAFGMAGLRVGWIANQDPKLLEKIRTMKDYLSICNSAPSEILSMITLRNKDKILGRNNQIVAQNIALLDEFFNNHSDLFSWVRPQGGCVGFAKYNGPENIHDFATDLHKQKGVLLLPGSVYEVPGNYFRIGFGRSNMPEALSELERYIADTT